MEGETLRRIWENGWFDRLNLCTQTGQPLLIHFPGVYRSIPAPHFAGACLELDGDTILGCVFVLGNGEFPYLKRRAHTLPGRLPALLVTYRNAIDLRRGDLCVPVLELSGKISECLRDADGPAATTVEKFRLPAYICN